MENAIYTAAVLGSLCDDNAAAPSVVASVINLLAVIDRTLTVYAEDEDKSGIDHTAESDVLFAQAEEQLTRLTLARPVELKYNDELTDGIKGRLRLEIPGTSWDADAPLYLN